MESTQKKSWQLHSRRIVEVQLALLLRRCAELRKNVAALKVTVGISGLGASPRERRARKDVVLQLGVIRPDVRTAVAVHLPNAAMTAVNVGLHPGAPIAAAGDVSSDSGEGR